MKMNQIKKDLIVAQTPYRGKDYLVSVLQEGNRPVELFCTPVGRRPLLGAVFVGVVEQIDPRLSAAFVCIRPQERVYLPLGEQDKDLHAGGIVAVQIVQEAQKRKLPKASRVLEAAGRFLVLSTAPAGFSFSRKLSSEEKQRLRTHAARLGAPSHHFLFRTEAARVSPEEWEQEYRLLQAALKKLTQQAAMRTAYSQLRKAPSLQERLLLQHAEGAWHRIVTDDAALAEDLSRSMTCRNCPVELYTDPQIALFRLHDLTGLLERSLGRMVRLPSGGTLIIEQTEAFTAIDVNTAAFAKKKPASEVLQETNREAAVEAARQIRLRQLSGTILIDFINSELPGEEAVLGALLQEEFAKDPVRTRLVDFTRLQIAEITRDKRYRSLAEELDI